MNGFHCYSFYVSNDPNQPKQIPNDIRWLVLQKKVHEDRIKRAFEFFRSNGVEPILIKGWAAGLSYPTDKPRSFSDTDLAVSAADYVKAARLTGQPNAAGLLIDLHRELRHYDSLSWEDLFDNSRLVKIDQTEIRVLRPEDHLRVLCVHWLNDGGADKERLWDIYYAVANRPADFDWERCLGTIPGYRRDWIIAAIGITHCYLGLEIEGLPFADEARPVPDWIKRCVEKEWASDTRLDTVIFHLNSPVSLLKQIRKRMPPNRLRAIIEMEGRMDARTHIFYQLGCMAKMLSHPMGARSAWATVRHSNDEE